jgi:hypothetical protein
MKAGWCEFENGTDICFMSIGDDQGEVSSTAVSLDIDKSP